MSVHRQSISLTFFCQMSFSWRYFNMLLIMIEHIRLTCTRTSFNSLRPKIEQNLKYFFEILRSRSLCSICFWKKYELLKSRLRLKMTSYLGLITVFIKFKVMYFLFSKIFYWMAGWSVVLTGIGFLFSCKKWNKISSTFGKKWCP